MGQVAFYVFDQPFGQGRGQRAEGISNLLYTIILCSLPKPPPNGQLVIKPAILETELGWALEQALKQRNLIQNLKSFSQKKRKKSVGIRKPTRDSVGTENDTN